MYAIDPGDGFGEQIIIGSGQTDAYEPLYARILRKEGDPDRTICRFRLTDAERRQLAEGGDLFLSIMQFGNPLQPVALWVDG